MSKGAKNSAHAYNGRRTSRANRLVSKLKGQGQAAISLKRLERLLNSKRKGDAP